MSKSTPALPSTVHTQHTRVLMSLLALAPVLALALALALALTNPNPNRDTKDKLEPTAFIASVLSGIELYNLPLWRSRSTLPLPLTLPI